MWASRPPRIGCVVKLSSDMIFVVLSAGALSEERKVHVTGLGFVEGHDWLPKGAWDRPLGGKAILSLQTVPCLQNCLY